MKPTEEALIRHGLDRGVLTAEQVSKAERLRHRLAQKGKTHGLPAILIAQGVVSRDDWQSLEREVIENHATAVRPALRPPAPRKGVQIPGYRVVRKLGEGAMGKVFKAVQESVERPVAIKVLGKRYQRDHKLRERFLREARMTARLRHENIIASIDFGSVGGDLHYFVMEFVDGETLGERLEHEGALSEAEALDIIAQMASALEHAHGHRMVHRDIKPENIMIDGHGVAKLCDLGLAKEVDADSSLTHAGTTVGTPHYIAPEQARGEPDIDIRADLYSLGATLFHLVTGRTPFEGSQAAAVMMKHLSEEPPPARSLIPDLSLGCERLIQRMMAKDRAERIQTPTELLGLVKAVQAGRLPRELEPPPRDVAAPHRASRAPHARRRPKTGASARPVTFDTQAMRQMAVGALAAATLLVILGGGIWALSGGDDEPAPAPPQRDAAPRVAQRPPRPVRSTTLAPEIAGEAPVESPPPVDARISHAADAALAENEAWYRENPTNAAAMIERLDALRARYPESYAADAARRLQEEIRERESSVAALEWRQLQAEWERSGEREQERWGRMWENCERLITRYAFLGDAIEPVRIEAGDLRDRIDERFRRDNALVDRLVREARACKDAQQGVERYAEAGRVLEGVAEYGAATEIALTSQRIRELESEARDYLKRQEERFEKVQTAYREYWLERERLLYEGQAHQARALVDLHLADTDMEDVREPLESDRADIDALLRVEQCLAEGLALYRDEKIPCPYLGHSALITKFEPLSEAFPWGGPDYRITFSVEIAGIPVPVNQETRLGKLDGALVLALAREGARRTALSAIEQDRTLGLFAAYYSPAGIDRWLLATECLERCVQAQGLEQRVVFSTRERAAWELAEYARLTDEADDPSAEELDSAWQAVQLLLTNWANTRYVTERKWTLYQRAASLEKKRVAKNAAKPGKR